jgi:hypothetical protein
VILFFSELILRKYAGDEVESYRARYKELFNHTVDAPILILGSSGSAHGVVPSLLGLSKPVFNFSFNGASCQFNLALYRQYLKPYYRKPEYLIYVLSPGSFAHFTRNIEDDVKYTAPSTEDIIPMLLRPWNLEVFKSAGIAHDVLKGLSIARRHAQGIYIGMDMRKYENGYLPYNSGQSFNLVPTLSINADPSEITALGNLFKELKQDGIKIILVTLPSPNKQYRQADLDAFDNTIDELATNIQAPVIRANNIAPAFGKDYTLFNDDTHLTETGANLFSTRLGEALRDLIKPEYTELVWPVNAESQRCPK